ncbi:hypothetical protein ABZZ79_34940 [Streptomyces sp. NPDC006458]|uniref:hypothetical protein n=1 Tax=Streptomyces sp. NPDC006458 TaxID=3154302 RepID=UPI0033BC9E24
MTNCEEIEPGMWAVRVYGEAYGWMERFTLVWRKGRFALGASTRWQWEPGTEEGQGHGCSDELGIRAVAAFISANPQPEPVEVEESEELPVKVVQDWHRGDNFDPSARERTVECGGVFYRVGQTIPGYAMTISLRGGFHFNMGDNWEDVEEKIRAHRAELFATVPDGAPSRILTTSKGMPAQLYADGRTARCYSHCADYRCEIAGECTCPERPVVSVDGPQYSYVWENCPECVCEEAGFRLESLPLDGWTPYMPEPCPAVPHEAQLIEDRSFGVGLCLICECGECLPDKLKPVIRADQDRAYTNLASVAPRAVEELLAELGYAVAGDWRSCIVGLSGGNANAKAAPVRPLDGDQEQPVPGPACDMTMRYAETGKSQLSSGGKTVSGICTCGKTHWRDSTLVRNPRVDGGPFDRFLSKHGYERVGLWGSAGTRVPVRPLGGDVQEQPEPEPEFPVELEPGETVESYAGEHHRPEDDGHDWTLTTAAGHGYRLCARSYEPDRWQVARAPFSTAGSSSGGWFWWAELDEDNSLAAAVAWCRADSESAAWAADVWARYGHVNSERVAWSAQLTETQLEDRVWRVERYGRVGIMAQYPWGWEHRPSGWFVEAGSGGGAVDGAFRRRAAYYLTVDGLHEVPTERWRIVGTDAPHGKDAAECAPGGWEHGGCRARKSPGRFLVDILGEDGETVMGRIGVCAEHLAPRLVETHSHQGEPWAVAYKTAGKVGGHMGSWVDWKERLHALVAEMVTAALEAGESNPRPDVVAALYAEAEAIRAKQEVKAANKAVSTPRTAEEQPQAPAEPKEPQRTARERTEYVESLPPAGRGKPKGATVRAGDRKGEWISCGRTFSISKRERSSSDMWGEDLPLVVHDMSTGEPCAPVIGEARTEALAKQVIRVYVAELGIDQAPVKTPREPKIKDAPDPVVEDPYGPFERGQIVTVDGREGEWCLMAKGQNHGVWQAEPATLDGGSREEFKVSELSPWGAAEALAGYHALGLYKEKKKAAAWMLPVDAKGRPIRLGDLVVQHYYEQSEARRVQRVYRNGNWLTAVVGEDGSVSSEHCNNVQIVTQEQVDALAEPLRVEEGGHRGRIVQALVTRHAGQFRATCSCKDGLELIEPGSSREVWWFKTQEAALAAWHEHAAEPVQERVELELFQLMQKNPAADASDGTEGMWWVSCRGGAACPEESEHGHIVSPAGELSWRETKEAARALAEWHIGGEYGSAPGDVLPGVPESVAVIWASDAYGVAIYRGECAGCGAAEEFSGNLGAAKNASTNRKAVRDQAAQWAQAHACEDAADTAALNMGDESASTPAGRDLEVQEEKAEPADEEPVAVFIVSARSNPTHRRVLWAMTQADAKKLCSDRRTAGRGHMLCWTAPEHLGELGTDWEWAKDRGTTAAVIDELGVTILDREVVERAVSNIPAEPETPAGESAEVQEEPKQDSGGRVDLLPGEMELGYRGGWHGEHEVSTWGGTYTFALRDLGETKRGTANNGWRYSLRYYTDRDQIGGDGVSPFKAVPYPADIMPAIRQHIAKRCRAANHHPYVWLVIVPQAAPEVRSALTCACRGEKLGTRGASRAAAEALATGRNSYRLVGEWETVGDIQRAPVVWAPADITETEQTPAGDQPEESDEEETARYLLELKAADVLPKLGWSASMADIVEWAAAGDLYADGKKFKLTRGRPVRADRVRLLAGAGYLVLPKEDGGQVTVTADGETALSYARALPSALLNNAQADEAIKAAQRREANGKGSMWMRNGLHILPGGETEKLASTRFWDAVDPQGKTKPMEERYQAEPVETPANIDPAPAAGRDGARLLASGDVVSVAGRRGTVRSVNPLATVPTVLIAWEDGSGTKTVPRAELDVETAQADPEEAECWEQLAEERERQDGGRELLHHESVVTLTVPSRPSALELPPVPLCEALESYVVPEVPALSICEADKVFVLTVPRTVERHEKAVRMELLHQTTEQQRKAIWKMTGEAKQEKRTRKREALPQPTAPAILDGERIAPMNLGWGQAWWLFRDQYGYGFEVQERRDRWFGMVREDERETSTGATLPGSLVSATPDSFDTAAELLAACRDIGKERARLDAGGRMVRRVFADYDKPVPLVICAVDMVPVRPAAEPEPRDWFTPVVMPEPVADDGPDYAELSRANRAAVEEQPDRLAELREELAELRRDVETWGAEVAALAVDAAEQVVRQAYAELRDMQSAELSIMLRQAQTLREELLDEVEWESVPVKRRPWATAWTTAASWGAFWAAAWAESIDVIRPVR